jgi:alkaline phosphatase
MFSLRGTAVAASLIAVVAGGTAVAAPGAPRGKAASHPEPAAQAKNVILLIGDGMGVTHVDAARQRFEGAAGKLSMERMEELGQVRTYAVERNSEQPELVTDSASAATAWASGVKTYNAAIGVDAFGEVVPTIMEQAKTAGLRTGNVTTSEITDATPAAQFSHVSLRGCQGPDFSEPACEPGSTPIAEQIARNNVADVIFGGGLSRFEPDDEAAMKQNGYRVLGGFGDPALEAQTAESQTVATRTGLRSVNGRNQRVIGLFNRGNLTVETAKRENPGTPQTREPRLEETTRKAIELLHNSDQGRRKGFFLQVEGALIDKRSHANDAAQTLGEMKAFDDAVAAALEFARRDRNTLVIVTADHECAGFNIIGKGSYTNAEATAPPSNVDTGNTANNSTPSRPTSGAKDPERSTGPVNGAGEGDPANFAPATFRTADDPRGVKDGDPEASLWLSYLSGNHTGADVNIYSSGPGAEMFDGNQDNTELYGKMRAALRSLGD